MSVERKEKGEQRRLGGGKGSFETHCCVVMSLRILMRYCVILVTLCLHLWMVKLGQ